MGDKITKSRPRPDRKEALSLHTEPGDNRQYLMHSLKMWDWPSVDMKQPAQVEERIVDYFQLCADDDMKPSVAGLALAFGVSRNTLWRWSKGIDCITFPGGSCDLIKKAYQILNVQMENYMQNGKINPVAGIFLMKNNMGYTDKQELVLTPNQQLGDQVSPEELQKKYLTDTAGGWEQED